MIDKLKILARKNLVPLIRDAFKDFNRDLIEQNTKDVYIDPSEMNGHPVLETYQPKAPHSEALNSKAQVEKKEGVRGALCTINQKSEFQCSPQDLYDTLLDPQRVSIWSRGSCKIQKDVGSFELFNSNVTGNITNLVPNKQIQMQWRFKTWPEGHFSQVTIDIKEGSSGTELKLIQKLVPVGEVAATETNWK